jgi:hypothetical protein
MRRIAVLVAVTLALAFPAIAVAKTVSYSFTLGHAGRTFTMHLAHTGRIKILMRYSRLRNPKADIIVSLVPPGDPDGNVVFDTAEKGSCKAAGDSFVCAQDITGLPAGKYQIRMGVETRAKVITHLNLSWPAP